MSDKPRRETFLLELEALDDPLAKNYGAAGRDPAYRLRLALKHFARSYGLKCTSVGPGPRPADRAPPEA